MSEPVQDLTDDAFLGGTLRILQPGRGFRSGLEAVLLAASIPAGPGQHALEAGAGAGVASLCLARRVAGLTVTGLELDPELAALANQNASRNGLADRVRVEAGPVALPPRVLLDRSFDHVFANPPFMTDSETVAADPKRRDARQGPEGTLEQFVTFCLKRAAPKGRVTLVHRADRADRILAALDGRLGALTLFPLWPKEGLPAKRVIIAGEKTSRAPLTVLPGLVLHDGTGAFTPAADAILREGAPLRLEA